MEDLKTVDEQTLEWWVMGTPETFCGVPNNHYLRWDDSDPLKGHYEETEHLREATIFDTKEDAIQEIATSLVQNDLEWDYGDIVPLKVTENLTVEAE